MCFPLFLCGGGIAPADFAVVIAACPSAPDWMPYWAAGLGVVATQRRPGRVEPRSEWQTTRSTAVMGCLDSEEALRHGTLGDGLVGSSDEGCAAGFRWRRGSARPARLLTPETARLGVLCIPRKRFGSRRRHPRLRFACRMQTVPRRSRNKSNISASWPHRPVLGIHNLLAAQESAPCCPAFRGTCRPCCSADTLWSEVTVSSPESLSRHSP